MNYFKRLSIIAVCAFLLSACQSNESVDENTKTINTSSKNKESSLQSEINVQPISHATAVIKWADKIIYTDPVGGAEAFEGKPSPNLILITDIHGDHLSEDTLKAVATDSTVTIMPQAVADELEGEIKGKRVVINNGEVTGKEGFNIEAIPMYNLPESDDSRHIKGRGNGYVLERNDQKLYLSGDTAGIPEMRKLQNIDIALVCMNLPYTMDVEEAADAVLDFKPKKVLPYHYRGKDGLSDVAKFKELVNTGNPNIEVIQLDWYPDSK